MYNICQWQTIHALHSSGNHNGNSTFASTKYTGASSLKISITNYKSVMQFQFIKQGE